MSQHIALVLHNIHFPSPYTLLPPQGPAGVRRGPPGPVAQNKKEERMPHRWSNAHYFKVLNIIWSNLGNFIEWFVYHVDWILITANTRNGCNETWICSVYNVEFVCSDSPQLRFQYFQFEKNLLFYNKRNLKAQHMMLA